MISEEKAGGGAVVDDQGAGGGLGAVGVVAVLAVDGLKRAEAGDFPLDHRAEPRAALFGGRQGLAGVDQVSVTLGQVLGVEEPLQ